MKRQTWFLVLILFFVTASAFPSPQSKPVAKSSSPSGTSTSTPAFTISPNEKAKRNPLPFTSINIERGKKLFATECVLCHGQTGVGNGTVAQEMKITPSDLTQPALLTKLTDGEIYAIISQGNKIMPGEKGRLSSDQRWEIVEFIRSLEGKTPGSARGHRPEERTARKH